MKRKKHQTSAILVTLFSLIMLLTSTSCLAKNNELEVTPLITKNDSIRIAHWKTDLLFLKEKFETEHYSLFRKISKKEWNNSFKKLIQNIKNLKDHEVITEAMKIIAKVGDGHTSIYLPFQGRYHFHQIPIAFHDFEEGVFIKGASSEYKHLVGLELVSIGDIPINEIKNRLKTITPRDNAQWIKVLGLEIYMTIPEVLYALELTNDINKVDIQLKDKNNKIINATISANLFDISSTRFTTVRPKWLAAHNNSSNELPLYRKRTTDFPNDFYWFEHIKESSLVYCQVNVVFDKPTENLESFYNRMFKYIEEHNIDKLVIDLRLNSGGNNQLNSTLVNNIINSKKINKKGNLFVIIGRRTFSAAMNLSTNLEQKTNAIFVGEPTGSSPNFVGEDNRITLPKSKIFASASNKYWEDSKPDDQRKWITPNYVNILSFDQYKNNIDPNMQSILKLINK